MKPFRFVCASPAILLFCALLFAQTPANLAFEVASIKPVPKQNQNPFLSGKSPNGMTVNGARVDYSGITLGTLLTTAYGVKASQIVGPDWLNSQNFEIHAKIPKGASKELVPEMLQALLADRFKLVAHRENREQPVYALVVSKGQPKLKKAVDDTLPVADDPAKTPSGPGGPGNGSEKASLSTNIPKDALIIKQEGGKTEAVLNTKANTIRLSLDENGDMHEEFSAMTMTVLANLLTGWLDRPVVDMTDLKDSYQVRLEIPKQAMRNVMRSIGAPEPELGATAGSVAGTGGLANIAASDPSDGEIMRMVKQLGLKLDPRKVPVENLVIDSIEKNPTEN